jgi:uncharacterized membrane protein
MILLKGIYLLGEKIHEMAMEEFLDEDRVREELKELYVLLEAGKISEDEFESKEEELVGRLEEIESYKNS